MSDRAIEVAFNESAPQDERADANAQLHKSTFEAVAADVRPDAMLPLIKFVSEQYEEQEFQKSLRRANVIPFPSPAVQKGQPGMQSLWLDDQNFSVMGEWYERPSGFSFDAMRAMVEQTPILNSVIMTRIRQIQRFARVQESGKGPGFKITLRNKDDTAGPDEKSSILLLQDFFSNSGWEKKPRQRMRLKRDDFSSFMAKLVRDSLTLDSCPIETEFKRDKSLGLDGMYAADGATIRLCTERGYNGDDEIFALQLVEGRIRSVYTYDDLIYVPRNPRTDVRTGGYGLSETELLIRVVTGFLNAFTYNTKYFDSNQIPKGLLHLTGNFGEQDIASFKRMWNAMVRGVNNAWALPVMVSKDQESKASFENFGVEVNEMLFGKWITFLSSLICGVYGIAPDEINFESFTTGTSSLSGSDTEEKLANSKDKGLRPLLSYFENTFTDFIVSEFSDKYVFRWTGLDEEDEKQVFERKKLIMTVNEMRAEDSMDEIKEAWGDAPLNPALMGAWQAGQQQGQEDFGQPGQGQPGAPGQDEQGKDFGNDGGGGASGADFGQPGDDAAPPDGVEDDAKDNGEAMQKSFGLPIFKIEA